MMERTKPVTVDEVSSDIGHLAHLLDTAVFQITENVCWEGTQRQKAELDRLSAFLWIARDMAQKAERDLQVAMKEQFEKKREAR